MDYRTTITSLLMSTNRPGIKDLIDFLNESDFFVAPASSNYHGNYESGLAIHSYYVYKILAKLVKTFNKDEEVPEDSIIISGLLHDLCKVNFYNSVTKWKKDDKNKWISYQGYEIDDNLPYGHGTKSVIILLNFIKLTQFETYSILYHMGIPESYSDKMSFNKALEMCPNMILLHISDLLSSAMFESKI